jgi:hypothetical protein
MAVRFWRTYTTDQPLFLLIIPCRANDGDNAKISSGMNLYKLKIVHQQLEMNGNSDTILAQDAIQALQNGDIDIARSHVLALNQQLASPLITPSQGSLTGAANAGPAARFSANANLNPNPVKCPSNKCLPNPDTNFLSNAGYSNLNLNPTNQKAAPGIASTDTTGGHNTNAFKVDKGNAFKVDKGNAFKVDKGKGGDSKHHSHKKAADTNAT